ncbi:MAG: hypothetical protein SNI51_08380 [Rikenellaceae bacterium]
MKRSILTTAVLLMSMMLSSVSAQTRESGDVIIGADDTFCNNWFISGGVGTSMYAGESDRFGDFGGRLATAIDLSVGKWFSPYIGARAQYNGTQLKGYSFQESSTFAYGDVDSDGLYKQKWSYMHLHFDAMLNLSNLICGYDQDRAYSLIPYAGIGWA